MTQNTKMKGVLASVILLSSGVLVVAFLEIARLKKELGAVPPPVYKVIRDFAKDKIITQAEAEAASFEILKQLWGNIPDAKVVRCTWDENSHSWVVPIQNSSGFGCAVTISELGLLEKAEVAEGM